MDNKMKQVRGQHVYTMTALAPDSRVGFFVDFKTFNEAADRAADLHRAGWNATVKARPINGTRPAA